MWFTNKDSHDKFEQNAIKTWEAISSIFLSSLTSFSIKILSLKLLYGVIPICPLILFHLRKASSAYKSAIGWSFRTIKRCSVTPPCNSTETRSLGLRCFLDLNWIWCIRPMLVTRNLQSIQYRREGKKRKDGTEEDKRRKRMRGKKSYKAGREWGETDEKEE